MLNEVRIFKVRIVYSSAYADDIVLLAPSWHGLQELLNIISTAANEADLCFNTKKTVTQ